ncbi:AGR264Cp [Eremothecium gossypii ATCC 10895]|uniref:Protein SEY1 n=1 Tax=Eremothecium gossypii (strain ATCC 10895 / CBS 109.51 / FGSC 9923 / NRRL Y-1056) TaxID=284811 RepID=SEY1_EREGS|nr:AGR264Cp [Eremothecium gossypii ATCC 10895]Q74ZD5.1 RecName: Full=Protein SEY1 [Eremothecium gossypii ATCC 10895]AAS54754.1 AGR264Cp [Eremothecium gossypii ATCC 10895]
MSEDGASKCQDSIQLIDEQKQFNEKTLEYFKRCIGERDVGLDYHVISVFGSQSSGKSTLLNALFNTKFDTMNAQVKRQQTTKGIWIAHTREVQTTANTGKGVDFFVLDVEGSDGAERGEDKDFERKAALFALATSEVLIVNMWEQQVGLYQGNNMGLLKTVFEVNLSLFGHKKDKQKILLLFVVRDFTGFTPLSSLQETLTNELQAMWSELNKPAGAEGSSLDDFFDFAFTGLSHKLFKPEEFASDVAKLGDKFTDLKREDYYLSGKYHQGLPLDGWSFYADSCWEQIENNKDLDLPTQQTLVANFKTEEIANNAFEHFSTAFSKLSSSLPGPELAASMKELKDQCTKEYDNYGSRYMKAVYLEKRGELLDKIKTKFSDAIAVHMSKLFNSLVSTFQSTVAQNAACQPLSERLKVGKERVMQVFEQETSDFVALELIPSVDADASALLEKIDELAERERGKEMKAIILRAKKYQFTHTRDDIVHLLSHPQDNVWQLVMDHFDDVFRRSVLKYKLPNLGDVTDESTAYDFQLDLIEEDNYALYLKIRSNAWTILYDIIHQYLKEDNVVSILRERFESKFRYDQNDVPRLWKNEEEVDAGFKVAREHALNMLNTLSIASCDGVEIVPDVPLASDEDEAQDEQGLYNEKRFGHILTAIQKEKIIQHFKRFANVAVVEAKRSTIKSHTHIPMWIYAIIAVLGWNEFMLVLRNPLFIALMLLIVGAAYTVHRLNLWTPLATFASAAVNETTHAVKAKLRTILLDDEHPKNASSKPVESFEMQDLSVNETKENANES